MTGFFDEPRPSGTNRAAPPTDCETCGGDRLIFIEVNESGTEVWGRCPVCSPAPAARVPVQGARWQDYDR